VQIDGTTTPERNESAPEGWPTAAIMAFNLAVPMPDAGEYAFELMIDGELKKTIRFRVVVPHDA
jgi:hypothetical protein